MGRANGQMSTSILDAVNRATLMTTIMLTLCADERDENVLAMLTDVSTPKEKTSNG